MTARRIRRAVVRTGAAGLALVLVYVAVTFVQVLSANGTDDHDPADAIVVLGAAQYDGVPSPVLAARLDHALDLYRGQVAPIVVVTGGKQPGDRFTEAAAGYGYLRDRGVTDDAILREEQGSSTWEQLAAVRRLLAARGLDTVVLVSDDYHARRLQAIASEVGLGAQVSSVDPGLSFGGRVRALGRETVAVALGRVIGFRRLGNLR